MSQTELSEETIERITPTQQGMVTVDCPECEYEGEDMRLQGDGSIDCPECPAQILSAQQFQNFKQVWSF